MPHIALSNETLCEHVADSHVSLLRFSDHSLPPVFIWLASAPLTGSRTDQVRLWRSERSKDDILRFMRVSGGDELMAQRQDMIAYWDFNEPDDDRQSFLPPSKA